MVDRQTVSFAVAAANTMTAAACFIATVEMRIWRGKPMREMPAHSAEKEKISLECI